MKKRPFLGVVTVLSAVPFLLFLTYFTSQYQPPLAHWFVLEKVVISVLGIVGGVFLWRGNVWGYRVGLIAWALITLSSLASLVSLYQASGQPDVVGRVATTWMSKDVIYILIAAPILYVLVRDLIERKRTKPE
jgi:hypothetical protein